MKRLLSAAALIPLMFSATLPNAWAENSDEQLFNNALKENGRIGKTMLAFANQLDAYSKGKSPAELEKFYSGLQQKLETMEGKLSAKCGKDWNKAQAGIIKYVKSGKAGACSNALLLNYFKDIVSNRKEVLKVVEKFEDEVGYLSLWTSEMKDAILPVVSSKKLQSQFYEIGDCEVSKLFFKGSKLDFGKQIGDSKTLVHLMSKDGSEEISLHRTPILADSGYTTINPNSDKESVLRRNKVAGLGKRVIYVPNGGIYPSGFDKEITATLRPLPQYGMSFELVQFEDYSDIIQSDNPFMNLGILHCRLEQAKG